METTYVKDLKDTDQTNVGYKQTLKFQMPDLFDTQYGSVLQSFVPERLKFTLENVNTSIANGLRRTIMNDVGSYNLSISDERFEENDTIYTNDDHLRTRFEMIPLYISDMNEKYLNTVKGLVFKIRDSKNKNDMYINTTSMVEHFRIQDLLVLNPELKQNEDVLRLFSYLFNKSDGRMVSDINILSLRPNNKMKFDVRTAYKTGGENGCFQSAMVTYTIYETRQQEQNKQMFDFVIESNGHYPPRTALHLGLQEIQTKLSSFISTTVNNIITVFNENSFTNENAVELSFDKSSMLLDIKVLKETHTLGGLVQEHLIEYLPNMIKMCVQKRMREHGEKGSYEPLNEEDMRNALQFIYEKMKIFYKKAHPLDEHITIGMKIVLPTNKLKYAFNQRIFQSNLKHFKDDDDTLNKTLSSYDSMDKQPSKMLETVSFYIKYLIYVCDRIYDTYYNIYTELEGIGDIQPTTIGKPVKNQFYGLDIPVYGQLGFTNGYMYSSNRDYLKRSIIKETEVEGKRKKVEKTNLERAVGRLYELTNPDARFKVFSDDVSVKFDHILDQIIRNTSSQQVYYLDIGCGDGAITSMIGSYINEFQKQKGITVQSQSGKEYICAGTDILDPQLVIFKDVSKEQLEQMSETRQIGLYNLDKIGIYYIKNNGSLTELHLPPNKINLITAFESLHHINDDGYTSLRYLDTYMEKNGFIIIREHDVHPEDTELKNWIFEYHKIQYDDDSVKRKSFLYLPILIDFMENNLKYRKIAIMTYKNSYNPQHIFYAIFQKQ
jgi:DNA-directed RNA polymerase alpha subunit